MIRKANINDIAGINKLLHQVQNVHAYKRNDIFKIGEKKYTDNELVEIINDAKKPIFVYCEDSIVLGYAFCIEKHTLENHSVYERRVLYIDDLCVDENNRRLGIGKKLYYYVCDYARMNNYDSIELNVWECNPSAMAFYNSLDLVPLKHTLEKVIK